MNADQAETLRAGAEEKLTDRDLEAALDDLKQHTSADITSLFEPPV